MIKRSIVLSLVVAFCFLSSASASNVEESLTPDSDTLLAKIIASPMFGSAPLTVDFDAGEFLYHYGKDLSFSWDFNDGAISDGVNTSHTFNSKGTYTVGLTVTTPFGQECAWVVVIVN